MRRVDRREFAREASLAFLSGVTVTVSGCGGGGGSGGSGDYSSPTTVTPPATGTGDEVGQISGNHGHEAIIRAALLMAGGDLQLDIAGQAGHSHLITLPAAAVIDVRSGRPVAVDSTSTDAATGGGVHSHTVTFNAESTEPPIRY